MEVFSVFDGEDQSPAACADVRNKAQQTYGGIDDALSLRGINRIFLGFQAWCVTSAIRVRRRLRQRDELDFERIGTV